MGALPSRAVTSKRCAEIVLTIHGVKGIGEKNGYDALSLMEHFDKNRMNPLKN
jgi:hypothetical protein